MDGRSEFEVTRREHEEGSKMAQKELKNGSKMAYTQGDRVLLSIDSDVSRFIVKIYYVDIAK